MAGMCDIIDDKDENKTVKKRNRNKSAMEKDTDNLIEEKEKYLSPNKYQINSPYKQKHKNNI